jgi:hypothetical protein
MRYYHAETYVTAKPPPLCKTQLAGLFFLQLSNISVVGQFGVKVHYHAGMPDTWRCKS